jgi:hypothetical protein
VMVHTLTTNWNTFHGTNFLVWDEPDNDLISEKSSNNMILCCVQ